VNCNIGLELDKPEASDKDLDKAILFFQWQI